MALSRFEARRDAVLNEANAIGTTALRARLLPDPHRAETLKLLREYIQIRLDIVQSGQSLAGLKTAVDRSNGVQEALWLQVKALTVKDKGMVPTGLFIQALNVSTRIVSGYVQFFGEGKTFLHSLGQTEKNSPRTNACRSISPSRPVKRMTIGCVRFCSARCSHKQCCSQIADTTRTGSGSLPDSKELGRTFRRNEIGKTQSALVPICIAPAA